MESLASPARPPASRISGRASAAGAAAGGNEERRERDSGRGFFPPFASLGQTQGGSLAEGEHALGSSLEHGDGRDPARMQDENFANIFVHFLQTFKKHEDEEEDLDEDAGRHAPIRGRLQESFQLLMEKLAAQMNAPQFSYFLQVVGAQKYIHEISSIRCNMLGSLLSIRGQVTRTTDVRPELLRAAFKCLECGTIEPDVEQQFKYTQPRQCRGVNCNNTTNWELLFERCRYGDWQKIRLQEPSNSSASSSAVPRSLDIIVRHDLVDSVYAGDVVVVSGALVALPDIAPLMRPGQLGRRDRPRRNEASLGVTPLTGLKGLGVREMNFRISLLAVDVQTEGETRKDYMENQENREFFQASDFLNSGAFEWLRDVAEDPQTLDRLAKSVAPRVWGNDDIKKGILLLMTGGVPKSTANARLRGDINMCIVGDPSTSKSQLLTWVERFSPRAVFASGKGSTAAGLTAAVVRDADQGDFVLEAGALMYADQGICCIDEFDKMDEKDRVAIHEAMEQQTISISKAGIQATLNARASVLAACNPRFGRYDKSKSFAANVNLPPPLLSRFDLFFTLIDEADEERDRAVFDHVASYHLTDDAREEALQRQRDAQKAGHDDVLTADELRVYIQCAQKLKPLMTDEAKAKLAETYVSLRLMDGQPGLQQNMRMTVRQLESLIRLSEAVARLKFSDFVEIYHVQEAVQIFRASLQRIVYTRDVVLFDESVEEEKEGSKRQHEGERNVALGEEAEAEKEVPKQIRISQQEYRRISSQIVDCVMQLGREKEEAGEAFTGVTSSAVIEWWLDEILKCDDVNELESWARKLQLIIRRLIEHEGYLVGDPVPDGPADELLLRVHPNVPDDQLSLLSSGTNDRGRGSVAFGTFASSFGYRSFDAEDTREQGEEEMEEEGDADLPSVEFEKLEQ
ncbi:putative DNA replication licensing factor [Neospora caninum Liverpool]|uniref:DNA replication licensing factor MCM6 n=1 Tax=Neospora caninum (strain Liverpool) TaxID=572307 RepID=F0VPK4_NEOCL|nr:putative DNA replication licensing factor [Neospora caninum Liverpool]CBZ55651.1 putative DNA replication licensing factor [Neospora caninum Liverpool]|eukprot:XP_003885677.1 putative DNA replication licensing factor [Neospora caninum Liverpool]